MICFGSYFLSAVELRTIVQRGNGGKIALPHIDADDTCMVLWQGVRRFEGKRDQQIEALLAPIIPEFGRANGCTTLQERHMPGVALIGHDDAALKGEDTDLVVFLQGIIPMVVMGQRRGDVLGRLVQPLIALLRVTQAAGLGILLHLGPQPAMGAAHLTRHVAGHLRRQAKLAADLRVGLPLQALLVARLAMRKRVGTDEVQSVAVGQLSLAEGAELIRRHRQFQFGGQRCIHRKSILCFSVKYQQGSGRSIPLTSLTGRRILAIFFEQNLPAIRLYESLGFQEAHREIYYRLPLKKDH